VPKLVIFRGDSVENEIRLSGNTLRIGRHNRNDVVLDDAANGVSRFHAEIRPEGGGYAIVDLNSRNGVWINGRRIKEKATLGLGVPATVGGFELTLEDDASTGEFAAVAANNAATIAAGSSARKGAGGQSAARSAAAGPRAYNTRQMLIWGGTGAALLLITVITFAVVRYKTRQAPPPETQVAVATTTIPVEPAKPTEEEIKKQQIAQQVAQHLEEARAQMTANDYAGALRDHVSPALELDPENAQALEMQRQANEAIAAAAASVQRPPRPPKPDATPTEAEVPGIPRRQNESPADYAARVKRVQTGFDSGRASLEKNDFAAAINHFRAVDREQPKYQGVDTLLAEATSRQQKAVEEALQSGQQNEQAGKTREARQWYQRALEVDPGSAPARERANQARARAVAAAEDLFTKANTAEKIQDVNRARQYLQQIVDTMLPGDEIRDRAAKRMEALKP